MHKFRVISLVASSLLVGSLMADTQTLNVNSGWNLLGTNLDNSKVEMSENILNVWKFTDNKWSNNDNNDLVIQAGNGFWINAKETGSIDVIGDISSKTLEFPVSGWNLSSPISGDLNVASISQSKYSDLWVFQNKTWSNKTQVTTIKVGEGFWIKTGESDLTLDQIMGAIFSSGSIDLGSIYTSDTTSTSRDLRDSDDYPPQIPTSGSVQVYSSDDENMSEPLLESAVSLNEDGTYQVEESDFTGDTPPQVPGFVVRVIAEKDGENFELSAIRTDSTAVDINPITTSVKSQIIDTIKTMFGEGFASSMSDAIISAINALTTAVSAKVEQDIKDGKLTLRKADFSTTKTPADLKADGKEDDAYLAERAEKDELLKTQLKDSSAGTDIAGFENKISYEKKTDFLKNNSADNIDLTKSAGNVDIAIMEYDMISTFAKMNLAIHDGKGRLILFLPVAPEDFDTLPGKEFNINAEDRIIGNDPALRAIDLEKDLRNANGSEEWAFPLIDTLLESPVVPYEVIKTLVKKDLYASSLEKFGNFIANTPDPDGGVLFENNPLKVLIDNEVELSSDAEESVKNILNEYMKPLLASSLLWMQDDLLFKAIETERGGKFLELFGIQDGDMVEDFVNRFKKSNEFGNILNEVGVPLIHGIPPFGENGVARFEDGYKFSKDSTILPITGIALMNMVMETASLQNIEITKIRLGDIVGEYLPESAKDLADKEIWWAVESEDNLREVEVSTDKTQWFRDFILGIASELSGEKITAESRFSQVMTNVKKYVKDFKKKVEEKEKSFFQENFVEVDSIDSTISFQVVDFDKNPLTEVLKVRFIPHLENIKTGEIKPVEDRITTFEPIDTQARFRQEMTVISSKLSVNKNGEIAENGEWRYIEDYNIQIVIDDGSAESLTMQISHPISLFPIAQNNLDYIFVDTEFDGEYQEGQEATDDFHYQVLENENKLFYPRLDKDLASYNNLNFEAMEGVKFGIMANNWEEQEQLNIWDSAVIPKPKSEDLVESFKVDFDGGISEGALIMLDIDENAPTVLRQLAKKKQLLMTIDFADEQSGEVGVAIEPMPEDQFDESFISEDGIPVCHTTDDIVVELTPREDGSYPFPEDSDFPAECNMDIFGKTQLCWDKDSQKDIELEAREDGTFPWPGDPDYPKECLSGLNENVKLDLMDCMGKEFPVDDKGEYIYPNDENKDTDFAGYDLGCMAEDYFGDFKDKFGDKFGDKIPVCLDNENQKEIELSANESGKYPLPGEEGFPQECMNKDMMVDDMHEGEMMEGDMVNMDIFNQKCDTNSDGTLDETEKEQCKEQFTDMSDTDMKDYLDNLKSKCDTDANGDIDVTEEAVCKAEFDGMSDEGVGVYLDMLKGKCDVDGDGTLSDTEREECQENLNTMMGERPEGKMMEGERPEGKMMEGERPEGEMMEGERPEGEMMEGERPEGEMMEGERPLVR